MEIPKALTLIINQLLDGANDFLKEGKEIEAAVFSFKVDGTGIKGAEFFSAEPFLKSTAMKEILVDVMNGLVKKGAADIVIMITEAWVLLLPADKFSKEDVVKIRPSQHPDKKEVVLFNIMTPTKQVIAQVFINREEDGTGSVDPSTIEFFDEGGEGALIRDPQDAVQPTQLH